MECSTIPAQSPDVPGITNISILVTSQCYNCRLKIHTKLAFSTWLCVSNQQLPIHLI